MLRFAIALAAVWLSVAAGVAGAAEAPVSHRYLYVAAPGIRDLLEYGGHGVLVFDIDNGFKFVRRIAASGVDAKGKPLNVKGVCASAVTGRLYVSTTQTMTCFDLLTDKILWEKPYPGGCDRMSMTPDGKVIYLPSFEGPHWNVVDAMTGDVIAKISPGSGAHNTVVGRDGSKAFLAGLKSPLLEVVDTATNKTIRQIAFSKSVRPFTVNGKQTLAFACVNDLLGFEIGDIATGKMIHRVEVEGFKKGPVARHGCPSHGIGLTPDEKEVWVCDGHNSQLHVFDLSTMPPKQIASIAVRDQPGWVTFTLDGQYAIASTGEFIDVKTKKVVAGLRDETGRAVHSEKVVEVQFTGDKVTATGDQFGVGRAVAP